MICPNCDGELVHDADMISMRCEDCGKSYTNNLAVMREKMDAHTAKAHVANTTNLSGMLEYLQEVEAMSSAMSELIDDLTNGGRTGL
jgi:hypothetical protein